MMDPAADDSHVELANTNYWDLITGIDDSDDDGTSQQASAAMI